MPTVIYAEKPDMARKIAHAIGKNTYNPSEKSQGFFSISYYGTPYLVTWGYGHLCRLANADEYNPAYKVWKDRPMPFIPSSFKIVLNTDSKMPVATQYKVVKKLFDKADCVINATDFDREGELIFYYVYTVAGCKAPIKRLKLSSTTEEGICDAFDNLLSPADFAGLLVSARCRGMADWIIGTNMTVAITLRSSRKGVSSIGRVQTPTLRMIVDRDLKIENFKPEDYFTLDAEFTTQAGEKYKGKHKTEKFDKRQAAEVLLQKCQGHDGVISEIVRTQKKKELPYLYNLSALQIEANKKHGIGAQKTLNIVQKLYEAGHVTYPRTDSRFLPEDMEAGIEKIQGLLKANGYGQYFKGADVSNMRSHRKHYFDNTKIGSHYAIIPTTKMPYGLSSDEKKIYDMICFSVIRMQHKEAVIENLKVTTLVNGEPFMSSGTTIIDPAWMIAGGTMKENLLPKLNKGDPVKAAVDITARKTEPPKHYTEATLLTAMVTAGKEVEDEDLRKFMLQRENSGIGTEATRAGIIELLQKRGYTVKEKNAIKSTPLGKALISAIPIEEIKSVDLTARYEHELFEIAEGDGSPSSGNGFIKKLYTDIFDWCKKIEQIPNDEVKKMADEKNGATLICPSCGKPLRKMNWGYGCTGYHDGCKFSVGAICGKMLTEKQVQRILAGNKLGPLNGFKKKDGTPFSGTLELHCKKDPETGKDQYRIWFEEKVSQKDKRNDMNSKCPFCHGNMVRGMYGWECERQCGLKIPYELCGRDISSYEADTILYHDQTPMLSGFTSKTGNPFNASLKLNKATRRIEFDFPEK